MTTVTCNNCGDRLEIPASPRARITLFNFSGLFSEYGFWIVLIVCVFGIPALTGVFSKDSEYDAIKKALGTPGVKVEVTKAVDGTVGWKIVKEAEPEKK